MIQHVQDTGSSRAASPATLSFTNNTSINNLIVVTCGGYGNAGSFSFTAGTDANGAGVQSWFQFNQLNSSGGAPCTATLFAGWVSTTPGKNVVITTSATSFAGQQMQATEFANAGPPGNWDTFTQAQSTSPGALPPSGYGQLFVASMACVNQDITAGPGGSWVNMGVIGTGANAKPGLGAYLIAGGATATTQNPTFTSSSSTNACIMVAFMSNGSFFELGPH